MQSEKLIFRTDTYKYSHPSVYYEDVVNVYSYLESRGGYYGAIMFFGLQYYLKKYLEGVVVTMEDINEAEEFCKDHFGRDDVFDRAGWEEIVKVYGGKLPLHIKAVPEGMIIPTKNVLMTIVNTGGKKTRFLTNFVETLLLKIWYPITVGTQSHSIKEGIIARLVKSGDPSTIGFKCHDFGYRGVTTEEHAALGGAAHLISFLGTDTTAGILMLREYYGAKMAGFSIPATEHSIICSYGNEGELDACRAFLKRYPTGTIACVSDTRNIYNACENIWGGALREMVMARNGTLVVRPDSGDFYDVVPRILQILWDKFGGEVNAKGYKILDSHVRIIQGDGMNPESILKLHDVINNLGWSSDN
ncbi:MAG: nicotinate phosphoribosyltransferase, partial [Richelia sp. RM2_1_2]|nr:nicotinate phosphoribosyltransferase [Richelia sp. RM2_1_2]